jgi:hypothetical protein
MSNGFPDDEAGFVYVFRRSDRPRVCKIGRSRVPWNRWGTLLADCDAWLGMRSPSDYPEPHRGAAGRYIGASCGVTFSMFSVPVRNWVAAERDAHKMLDDYRRRYWRGKAARGELFHVCPALAVCGLWVVAKRQERQGHIDVSRNYGWVTVKNGTWSL